MEELRQNESLIEGKWEFDGTSMNADEACKRIEWLTENKLKELAVDGDRWESLYQDPNDGRFWILTYPKSQKHGGGPPMLIQISEKKAHEKFNIK